jgi:hypothetical protein
VSVDTPRSPCSGVAIFAAPVCLTACELDSFHLSDINRDQIKAHEDTMKVQVDDLSKKDKRIGAAQDRPVARHLCVWIQCCFSVA